MNPDNFSAMPGVGEPDIHATSNLAIYEIDIHHHIFAAWAASRAASVKGCRFKVERSRRILEACGFNPGFSKPDNLPLPNDIDGTHRQWRAALIEAAKLESLVFTHGVAAKLINCYLKSRFVCSGHHENERVKNLHPPIDSVLLKTLAKYDVGGYAKEWRRADNTRWSKFDSDQYEEVIARIKQCLRGKPLWKIEKYWKGHQ